MWKVIGTAEQGRGHIERDIPCQDAIYQVSGDPVVIALADGAGSASHSHYGAEAVTRTLAHYVKRHFDELYEQEEIEVVRQMLFHEIDQVIDELEERYGVARKSFASTLLLVAVKEEEALLVHLGDGEIGAIRNGELVLISSGFNGEFANATLFTTSRGAERSVKLIKSRSASSFDAFFIMSDGTSESLYSKQRETFAPVFHQLALRMKYEDENILDEQLSASFQSTVLQRTQDDCSLMMMTRVDDAPITEKELRHIHTMLPLKRQPSFDKLSTVLSELEQQPLTMQQLTRRLHWKRRIIRPIVRALMQLAVVHCHKGRYERVGVVYD